LEDMVDLEAAGVAGIPLGQAVNTPLVDGIQVVAEVDLGRQAHILVHELPAAEDGAPGGAWRGLQAEGDAVLVEDAVDCPTDDRCVGAHTGNDDGAWCIAHGRRRNLA